MRRPKHTSTQSTKVQPFNAENHPHATRFAFSAEATVSGIRLLTIMACTSRDLYGIRQIAVMAGLSASTVSTELRRLLKLGYIEQTTKGWRLSTVVMCDDDVMCDDEQSDRQTDQSEPKRSADRSEVIGRPIASDRQTDQPALYNILNNTIKNNTPLTPQRGEACEEIQAIQVDVTKTHSDTIVEVLPANPSDGMPTAQKQPRKRVGRIFEPRESITVEQYQAMLVDPTLAGGDKEFLRECILEMRDWSHSNQKRKVDWAAALRNWIRRTKRDRAPKQAARPITFVESEQMRKQKVYENFERQAQADRPQTDQEKVQKVLAEQKELEKRRKVY